MVSAHGADAFAVQVLHRAGFVDTGVFADRWQRLPFDLGHARENTMACHAATVLSANGYRVELDPDLRNGTDAPASAEPYAGQPGLALSRLTRHLADEPDEDLQRLQRFVLATGDGVPDQISRLFRAAADRIRQWDPGHAEALALEFTAAAQIMDQAGAALDQVLTAPDPADRQYTPYPADPGLALARYTEAMRAATSPRNAAQMLQQGVLERRHGALDQLHDFLETTADRCAQYEPGPGHTQQGQHRAQQTARRAGASARDAAQLLPQVRDTLATSVTVLGRLRPPRRSEDPRWLSALAAALPENGTALPPPQPAPQASTPPGTARHRR